MSEPREDYATTVYTGFMSLVLLAFSPLLIALFVLSIPLWLIGRVANRLLGDAP